MNHPSKLRPGPLVGRDTGVLLEAEYRGCTVECVRVRLLGQDLTVTGVCFPGGHVEVLPALPAAASNMHALALATAHVDLAAERYGCIEPLESWSGDGHGDGAPRFAFDADFTVEQGSSEPFDLDALADVLPAAPVPAGEERVISAEITRAKDLAVRMRRLGFDRAGALRFCSEVVGRELGSRKELTGEEARLVHARLMSLEPVEG